MHKMFLTILALITFSQAGFCALNPDNINIINLKENGMYLIDLKSKINNISVGDNSIVDVSAINSVTNDMQQLFVQTNKTGICDLKIDTEKAVYKIRLILGQSFEENLNFITSIDMPAKGINK